MFRVWTFLIEYATDLNEMLQFIVLHLRLFKIYNYGKMGFLLILGFVTLHIKYNNQVEEMLKHFTKSHT